jgi:hypothetical protein
MNSDFDTRDTEQHCNILLGEILRLVEEADAVLNLTLETTSDSDFEINQSNLSYLYQALSRQSTNLLQRIALYGYQACDDDIRYLIQDGSVLLQEYQFVFDNTNDLDESTWAGVQNDSREYLDRASLIYYNLTDKPA